MAEVKDRGLLDLMGKEEEEKEVLATELEKVKLEEEKEEHQGILEKLHRADSTSSRSSSSSEEEEEETRENKEEEKEKMKKKKKSIEEKVKEKMECTPTTEAEAVQVAYIAAATTTTTPDEKKGLLDKIKDKIPGHAPKKPSEDVEAVSSPLTPTQVPQAEHEGEGAKEKKGFLGKIMDKIPGYHKNTTDDGEEKQGGATH